MLRQSDCGPALHYQYVLVERTIEDDHLSPGWRDSVYSPQKIVCGLFGGGLPKDCDVAALEIRRAHDVIDRSVLAPGVHRLQTDEQSVPAFRVEQFLEYTESLLVVLDLFGYLFVVLVVAFEHKLSPPCRANRILPLRSNDKPKDRRFLFGRPSGGLALSN